MIWRAVLDSLDNGLRRLAQQMGTINYNLPFGGKSVILLGDLAQVPAVVRTRDDFSESAEQFFRSLPYHFFTRFSLSVVMRQDPDQRDFMDLLTDVRSNDRLSPSSLTLLGSRFLSGLLENITEQVDEFVGFDSPNGMVVTFRNERASYYNNLILQRHCQAANANVIKLDSKFLVRNHPSFQCHPNQTPTSMLTQQTLMLSATLATENQIRLLFGAFRRHQFNSIIPLSLSIIPGARVMLLQNLNVHRGLINGARCTVCSYLPHLDTVEVRFDAQRPEDPPTLISRTPSVSYQLAHGQEIFIYQFPLKLC